MEKIGIVKLNFSNIKSLCYSLDNLQINYEILNHSKDIKNFKKIILPGTSNFKIAMNDLKNRSFDLALHDHVIKGGYLLGICIGMQILFSYGLEGGKTKGLNLIKGSVLPFKNTEKEKNIFHIGWNNLKVNKKINLLNKIDDEENFYFVHSYHCVVDENVNFSETLFNNQKIISVVNKNKIFGIQFHPEKSHLPGIKILKNFLDIRC
tara:strand:- start:340 stop:960 length:621 start_codon:yes stop_codon:yes gene_type:complete